MSAPRDHGSGIGTSHSGGTPRRSDLIRQLPPPLLRVVRLRVRLETTDLQRPTSAGWAHAPGPLRLSGPCVGRGGKESLFLLRGKRPVSAASRARTSGTRFLLTPRPPDRALAFSPTAQSAAGVLRRLNHRTKGRE